MISVVLPVYNCETYLDDAIKSIVNQDYTDWELVIVDDGSTDSSGDIARSYAREDSKIKLLTSVNRGVSAARNLGVRHASGKYIVFLDADDYYTSDALSVMLKLATETSADVVVAQMTGYTGGRSENACEILSGRTAALRMLYQNKEMEPSPCGRLFKSDLLRKYTFTEGMRYEDLELMPRLIYNAGKVAVTSKAVYHYRRHPQSFISQWSETRLDAIKATDKLRRYFEMDEQLRHAADSRRFSAYCNILGLCEANGVEGHDENYMQELRALAPGVAANKKSRLRNRLMACVIIVSPCLGRYILKHYYS